MGNTFLKMKGDVDQADEDGHFDQRADHGSEGHARFDSENRDGHGNGEFKVIACRGERESR